jgi:septum site-determining protein MinC
VQAAEPVIIKGVREGLLLILDDDTPYAQVLTALVERINARPGFFRGATVIINTGRRVMDRPEFDVLYKMLTRNGMRVQTLVSLSAQSRMVAESYGVASRLPSFASGDAGISLSLSRKGRAAGSALVSAMAQAGAPEVGQGLFLRCNLRPGQSVHYEGDVCVLGDVEVGAEIIASGDVVVWGVLRGIVYAGANGDDEAVICALQMSPTQLGIAGITNRYPADASREASSVPCPELARLAEGQIIIEPWAGMIRERGSGLAVSRQPPDA